MEILAHRRRFGRYRRIAKVYRLYQYEDKDYRISSRFSKARIKRILRSMKERIKKAWQWLRKHVINREILLWVIIAELIFWSPCIVSAVLAWVISPWWWTVFGSYIAFWSAPLTPAMSLQFGLAVALKKIHEKLRRKKK